MDTASTREYAGKKILELGATNPDLCVVGADLNKSTFTNLFAEKYPDRFFDVGIAEQNMVNIAAGLAASGKIPIVSTEMTTAKTRFFSSFFALLSFSVKFIVLSFKVCFSPHGVTACKCR